MMKRHCLLSPSACRVLRGLAVALALTTAFLAASAAVNVESKQAKKLFAHPPREFSSGPLWVWNDLLTDAEVRDTMCDLAAQDVKQVFVHPRPGLMTPYLSPEWFRLWKVALDEAAKLDMNVWIYDENSYPSGFAGGWVPELMPESRGQGLMLSETKTPPRWEAGTLAVCRIDGLQATNVTAQARAGSTLPAGRYVVATVVRAGNTPWNADHSYVNLLTPGVTAKFLDVTHEAYRREIGTQFGQRVPGVFTDEPNIRPAGGLPWCDDLPAEFQKRWGYSLLDQIASLSFEVGDWRKVRHDFFQTCNALFIERWSQPYHDYCATNHLEWTGHYWDHEWPNCGAVPDNMAMYAWHQRPAIDCLMNQFAENTHAQFGNLRMVRELSSVANQLGQPRTLCEVYGAGGWDLRFEDMKRIADWLGVLGVNTFDQHLSYITIRGARKRDHPQSFSYHEPWWEAYHVSADYLARLSVATSQGQQANSILVLEPTTTAWMYQGNDNALRDVGNSFFNLLKSLEAAQIEYDIGDEDIMARYGSIQGPELNSGLVISNRYYTTVVVPPLTENLNATTMDLLHDLLRDGGTVFCCGDPPARVDGALSDAGTLLAKHSHWIRVDPAALPRTLQPIQANTGFTINRKTGDEGILFHQRRVLKDGQLLLLVNSSLTAPSAGTLAARVGAVEEWDLTTGGTAAYPYALTRTGIVARFDLPPAGSRLLFLAYKPRKPEPVSAATTAVISPVDAPTAHRIAPNVLTLDYVDVTAGGESRSNFYFYPANQFAFQKNGLPRDPWDNAVQFKDELISRKFPAASGFTASYRFTIVAAVPPNLAIVIERPDLYTVTCNGRPVSAKPGDWWLDKAFGRIPLSSAARVGENVVTIQAAPFTIFDELEPAYVLGDFALKPVTHGFVIVPAAPVKLGNWNDQGMPFYAAGVAYRETFNLPNRHGTYAVTLPRWSGSVAKVTANGKLAGYITAPPWECDVTDALRHGKNTIEITVIGTLKNTLGPHHGHPALGSAWPGMFQQGPAQGPPPGADYSTVGYGLFAPFTLKQTVRP